MMLNTDYFYPIARNIVLLSLIIDSKDASILWSIQYDFYMYKEALQLLRLQAKKLYEVSETMDTWQQSDYGSCLKFCDTASLNDVRMMWRFYGDIQDDGTQAQDLHHRIQAAVKRTRDYRNHDNKHPKMLYIGTFPSTVPASHSALKDLDALHKRYWEQGNSTVGETEHGAERCPNPTFLTLEDEAVLVPDTDPLHGFHLAPAYAPPPSDSPWAKKIIGLPQLEKVVAVAQQEFSDWIYSFRKNLSDITIRFCVSDALSLAHTLQQRRMAGTDRAGWYRDQYDLQPLVLDGSDYVSNKAPMAFDIIDTSNLYDHLGPLNLFIATSPLLRNQPTSVLYVEVQLILHKTYQQLFDDMLCGHVPTLSGILGLFPVEYWTNTSSLSISDETMYDVLAKVAEGDDTIPSTLTDRRTYLRTSWKRPVTTKGPLSGSEKMYFSSNDLTHVLYQVYCYMFRGEDIAQNFSKLSAKEAWSSDRVLYNRASFASFVGLIKNRVKCDWNTMMESLFRLMRNTYGPKTRDYFHELCAHLHMLGVFSVDYLKLWDERESSADVTGNMPGTTPVRKEYGDLRDWKDIPPVVCITLKVPRDTLSVFTDLDPAELGRPPVYCLLEGVDDPAKQCYSSCQLAFGDIKTSGDRNSKTFEVSIQEDPLGWKGSSDLIVSFYVPTRSLLQDPRKVEVAFALYDTPKSIVNFYPKLGRNMKVYSTTLLNASNVYIQRYAPNQTGFPTIPGFASADLTMTGGSPDSEVKTTLLASVDRENGCLTTLTSRLDMLSDRYKMRLRGGLDIDHTLLTPCELSLSLGSGIPPILVHFPVAVIKKSCEVRVMRAADYIEYVFHVADGFEWENYPYFMYPIHLQENKPVNWNMPYVSLRHSPLVDTSQPSEKLEWLDMHLSGMISARERRLSDDDSLASSEGEQVRFDFKESLLTMILAFCGLAGSEIFREEDAELSIERPRVFGLCDPYNLQRGRIFIVVSGLRLDPGSRVAVLDCAVLPLHNELVALPEMHQFLTAAMETKSGGFARRSMGAMEMNLWKHVLPAWVERCREWEHRADCEYAKAGEVPINSNEKFLCSCGNGRFPSGFFDGIPGWDAALSPHAVRAAISPAFWAPYADEPFRPTKAALESNAPPPRDQCAKCNRTEAADGTELRACRRCKKVKYCSRGCQRAHWKLHRIVCK